VSTDKSKTDYHACRTIGIVHLPSGETEGLDPRETPRNLLEEIGHSQMPLLEGDPGEMSGLFSVRF
jgi:hypothetical protein